MTNNKSQGQTFKDKIGIYLPRPVFAHGMLYVGFSRVIAMRFLRVISIGNKNAEGVFTRNVVYPEVLRN